MNCTHHMINHVMGRGPFGSTTNPPTPPPSFSPTNHTTHPALTHVPWSLLRTRPSSA